LDACGGRLGGQLTLGERTFDELAQLRGQLERRGRRVGDLRVVQHDAILLAVVDDRDAAGRQHLVRDERDVRRRQHELCDRAVVYRVELVLGADTVVRGRELQSLRLPAVDVDID